MEIISDKVIVSNKGNVLYWIGRSEGNYNACIVNLVSSSLTYRVAAIVPLQRTSNITLREGTEYPSPFNNGANARRHDAISEAPVDKMRL
jgi:hypothetical protein